MNETKIPKRVLAAIESGAGGELLQAKRILGDRMRWLGQPPSSGTRTGTLFTCWGLDGSDNFATESEILDAASVVSPVGQSICVLNVTADDLASRMHDASDYSRP